jgi:C-terminal processing protease CtpA/Prc
MRPLVNLIISNNYPNYNKFLDEMFKTMSKNDVEKIIVDLRYNGGGNSILGNLFMYHCDIPDTIQDYSGGAIKISELFKQSYKNSYEYFKKDFLAKNEEKKFKIPKLIELDREEINDDYSFFKNIEEGNTPWKVKPVNDKFKGKIILLIGQNTFSSASMYATILSDNKQATLIGEPIGQKPTSFGDLLIFTLPETNIRATVSHKIFLRPDSSKDSDPTLYPDIEIYPTIEEYLNGKDPVFEKALGL